VVGATTRCVTGLLLTPCDITETRGVWLLIVHSIKFLIEVSKRHEGYTSIPYSCRIYSNIFFERYVNENKHFYGVAVVGATIRCVAGLLLTPCVMFQARGMRDIHV
jgi:uncharacterized membrane protein